MISTVMPIAYDYRYAFVALARIYDISDEIILGLDRDRISWSGKPFEFDFAHFQDELRKIDRAGKVRLIEENFHSEAQPMANDTRERNILSTHCREGNWVLQIDSDEYVMNPADFRAWLGRANPQVDVQGRWITVFKSFGDTCLVAQEPDHRINIATRLRNAYRYCRTTPRPAVVSNIQMLHYSWGRTRDELVQKLTNWSHSQDFDTARFLALWDSVTLENYEQFRNFHPLHPPLWAKLSPLRLPPGLKMAA